MNPIRLLRPTRFVFIALLALPCALCLAEDKPKVEAARPVIVDPYVISIDFPGGPLSKLVASLATDKDTKLSIIQSVGLDPVLPAFSVRDVRVDAVIAALGRIMEPQGYILGPVGPNVAVLTQTERTAKLKAQAFASFQLENKIGARSADDIIAAIQMGCEFADPGRSSSTLRFKYHPGTKLLFVAGTPQDVDVANRVFGSLPNNPEKDPTPPPEKK